MPTSAELLHEADSHPSTEQGVTKKPRTLEERRAALMPKLARATVRPALVGTEVMFPCLLQTLPNRIHQNRALVERRVARWLVYPLPTQWRC